MKTKDDDYETKHYINKVAKVEIKVKLMKILRGIYFIITTMMNN